MEALIKAALFTPTSKGWGLPVLWWGLSGVGKSDILEDVARKWRMHVEVLSPSERGSGAFGVTPVPRDTGAGGMVMTYPAPDWVESFEDFDGRGLVFLDELTTAPPMIQAAMLGLIQARRIGGATLGRGVRIMAAANPPDAAANGWDLAAPVANRVAHLDWHSPSEEDWGDYMIGGGKPSTTRNDPDKEEARVMAIWPNAYAKAAGVVAAFHRRNRGNLHKQPAAGDPRAARAWPSHRTWSGAIRALASGEVHNLEDSDTLALAAGFVGEGAIRELLTFRLLMDLPDPADVLDGKVKWEHDPERLDRSHAVLSSLVSMCVASSEADRAARIPRLWSVIDRTPADDVIAMVIKPASQARLTDHPAAIPVLARLRPLLKAIS